MAQSELPAQGCREQGVGDHVLAQNRNEHFDPTLALEDQINPSPVGLRFGIFSTHEPTSVANVDKPSMGS